MKALLTGNEAIARGAYEAGVKVAVGYPGTPSTEILENIVQYKEIYAQWSPNEKVAFEVAAGASISGARSLATMKHVGVNVAADPLFTFAYTGVNGGFVLVSADDPGMHSSQNEQDNRRYGKFTKIPVLEPSDSQEAKDFTIAAFDLSETFDTPVMLRTTTRIAHSQGMVELEDSRLNVTKEYVKNAPKYVMIPAHGRQRHLVVEKRLAELKTWAESTKLNRMEINDKKFGIITGGICYQYVKEAFPEASILKLGLSYPLPEEMIRKFAAQVGELFVVEELEPFWEEEIKIMGIKVKGKIIFPRTGELSARMIKGSISQELGLAQPEEGGIKTNDLPSSPPRPPVLCPGCPHRAVFHVLKKLKLTVAGDIGCYTLGCLPPLEAIDTTICMGASIGAALGMEKGNPDLADKVVAVIGDSTFFHSGITGLVDMVYNKSRGTLLILDNSTTAMTGHQDHPATGKTLMAEPTGIVRIGELARALGVKRVVEIDPFQLAEFEAVVKAEVAAPELSVIIAKRPCALLEKPTGLSASIDKDKCINCRQCMAIGCPAIAIRGGSVDLNESICTGCNLCVQICKVKAIRKAGENNA
ncbi:MAG: indolepyruvate ferredoxin oxidoreductase subunit alpha [Clostridia bacterium]|nr:indolepyruvate ferredoxin oxidoreductase subunit alpha [Clostridia bacterium]